MSLAAVYFNWLQAAASHLPPSPWHQSPGTSLPPAACAHLFHVSSQTHHTLFKIAAARPWPLCKQALGRRFDGRFMLFRSCKAKAPLTSLVVGNDVMEGRQPFRCVFAFYTTSTLMAFHLAAFFIFRDELSLLKHKSGQKAGGKNINVGGGL